MVRAGHASAAEVFQGRPAARVRYSTLLGLCLHLGLYCNSGDFILARLLLEVEGSHFTRARPLEAEDLIRTRPLEAKVLKEVT